MFAQASQKLKTRVAHKESNPKSDSSDSDGSDSDNQLGDKLDKETRMNPTDDVLFRACGGARLGMRARAPQMGKIMRAEETLHGETCVKEHRSKKQSLKNKKRKRIEKCNQNQEVNSSDVEVQEEISKREKKMRKNKSESKEKKRKTKNKKRA